MSVPAEPSRIQRVRRLMTWRGRPTLLAVVPLAVLLLAACSPNTAPSPVETVGPTSTTAAASTPTGDPAYVRARIRLGIKPCGVAVDRTKVWVSNYGSGTAQWVDIANNQPGPTISVGRWPCGIALGAGSVWVENFGSNDVTRIDSASGKVLATIPVGAEPYDVTFAFGAAWVTNFGAGTVSRIDPADNTTTQIRTGGKPVGIVAAGGAIWVGLGADGVAVRIDPGARRVTDRVPAAAGAGWTAATGDDLWVSNGAAESVTHIDTRARRVVRTVPVGGGRPLDGDVAAGAVWIPNRAGDVYRIDTATDALTGPFRTGASFPFVVAGSSDSLWVADYGGVDLLRLDLAALA